MDRRNLFRSVLAGAAAVIGTRTAQAASAELVAAKVVYHLTDLERVAFVLGNIQNHLDGMGGPDKVRIALVVHGPALKAFHGSKASPDVAKRVAGFVRSGVGFAVCGNTMKAQNVALGDLLPGFVEASEGGVVRLANLQAQGYAYLRP
jgi:intracellular sulfur oxidation DsrE/DsrF family protein